MERPRTRASRASLFTVAAGALAIVGCVAATTSEAPETARTSHTPRPIPVTPTVPEPPPPIAVESVVGAGDVGGAVDATRALFVQNCAPCHGASGDGRGTTKLERPARSFLAGGFSYGNTPEAITRSITHGIPGTPMPSFGATLKDDQRAALATYVISLGPPQIEVGAKETMLVVRDEPVFARGKLPPLVDGGPEIVRGLLVGTPDGLTFEYDLDDVRLVAVRTGEFADRRDWLGRGGDALRPLGTMIRDEVSRTSLPTFRLRGEGDTATPLRAVLRSTAVRDHRPVLTYDLVSKAGDRVANVEETPSILQGPRGPGFVRTYQIRGIAAAVVDVEIPLQQSTTEDSRGFSQSDGQPGWIMSIAVRHLEDGRKDATGVRAYYPDSRYGIGNEPPWNPHRVLRSGETWRVQCFGLLLPKSDVPVSVEGYQWP